MYCTGDVFKSNADPTLTFVLPPLLSAALSQTSDHITTFLVWQGAKEKKTTDKKLCSNYQTCKFPICIPSEIIGPESNHWLCLSLTHSLTDSLTNCCLVNLIDVTLACEDANSKLVEVVNVANGDDEDRVGNSLLQIWKLRFGHKAKLLFRL